MRIVCPSCHAVIKAPDKHTGKKVPCPRCKHPVVLLASAAITTSMPQIKTPPVEDEEPNIWESVTANVGPVFRKHKTNLLYVLVGFAVTAALAGGAWYAVDYVASQPPSEPQKQIVVKHDPAAAKEQAEKMQAAGGIVLIALIVIGSLLFWFFPVLVALARGHPDVVAVTLVTFFFGWSCIGWIIALIWSVKAFPRTSMGDARDY